MNTYPFLNSRQQRDRVVYKRRVLIEARAQRSRCLVGCSSTSREQSSQGLIINLSRAVLECGELQRRVSST